MTMKDNTKDNAKVKRRTPHNGSRMDTAPSALSIALPFPHTIP